MTDFELEALWLSARLALFTVLICLPVAMVVASWAGRRRGRGRWVLDGLLLLPLGLVCAALALLARRRPAPAEAGPDPSTYTLDPRSAPRPTPAKDAPSGPRYDLPPPS